MILQFKAHLRSIFYVRKTILYQYFNQLIVNDRIKKTASFGVF